MLLWHYTSVNVLASIFASHLPTLRAGHIHHLNDSSELSHGLNAMKRYYEGNERPNEAVLETIETMLSDEYDPETFSFSLSKAEDSLYQWIAYCPAQGGIALGFELSDSSLDKEKTNDDEFFLPIYPTATLQLQTPQYRKCHYIIDITDIDDTSNDWFKFSEEKSSEVNLKINAMFLKHKAFHFEEEHRLFFHPMNHHGVPIEFNGNKPFVNFHFKPEILKKIYISPRGDKKLTKKTVKLILKAKKLDRVKIEVSDIPFRE